MSGAVAGSVEASTTYVDGISDQSLPYWNNSFETSPFATLFHAAWAGSPPSHIKLARYVVQWNMLAAVRSSESYVVEFEHWLTDVAAIGLTPEIALTSYTEPVEHPPSSEYKVELERVLEFAKSKDSVVYVEPWNEPNNQGGFQKATEALGPAHYANEAHTACARDGCTVIAGNFEDNSEIAAYLKEYKRGLSWTPSDWGVHPYEAIYPVNGKYSDSNLESFERQLVTEGYSSAELWYTEVGAYYCKRGEARGSTPQAKDAAELVNRISEKHPAHVFYYQFMFKDNQPSPCNRENGESDTELYTSTDEPRPAASIIFGPEARPIANTESAADVQQSHATISGSINLRGLDDATGFFQ